MKPCLIVRRIPLHEDATQRATRRHSPTLPAPFIRPGKSFVRAAGLLPFRVIPGTRRKKKRQTGGGEAEDGRAHTTHMKGHFPPRRKSSSKPSHLQRRHPHEESINEKKHAPRPPHARSPAESNIKRAIFQKKPLFPCPLQNAHAFYGCSGGNSGVVSQSVSGPALFLPIFLAPSACLA